MNIKVKNYLVEKGFGIIEEVKGNQSIIRTNYFLIPDVPCGLCVVSLMIELVINDKKTYEIRMSYLGKEAREKSEDWRNVQTDQFVKSVNEYLNKIKTELEKIINKIDK